MNNAETGNWQHWNWQNFHIGNIQQDVCAGRRGSGDDLLGWVLVTIGRGEPMMDDDETIYGVHVQPLVGFSDHKVVGVNVAARMEPDISGDRKPNASEIVGLAVGAVFHEVRGDVCGVQMATAKCVDGIQISGINEARTVNGIQIGLIGNDGCANSRTNTSRCVQIGLVNVCGDHWFPLINFNFRDSRWCGNDEEVKCYPWGLKFRPW